MAILFLFQGGLLLAQDHAFEVDDKYGLDPMLYNGRFYTYFYPSGTKGSPFLIGSTYQPGSAILHDRFYSDLLLNYDLINQQVVLRYTTSEGGVRHIVLPDGWLKSFAIGNTHFEIRPDEKAIERIFQVIGNGPNAIYYGWRKELKLDTRTGSQTYIFSKPSKQMYFASDEGFTKFSGNNGLIKLLQPSLQSRVKKYLSQHKININKASDEEMHELVNYMNTLVEK